MDKEPKVLVISHNPFSDKQNNGKTLSSFFNGWNKKNIRQIFLTLDEYDTTICNNFYRISDIDVLKSLLKRKKNIGTIIDDSNFKKHLYEKKQFNKTIFYVIVKRMFQAKLPIAWLIRCIVWNISKPWKNDKLINWIKEFNPDVIFFQTSNFYVIYNMVIELKKLTNSKLIIETTDDYVTPHRSFSIIKSYRDRKMEKTYSKIVAESEYVIVIGEDMKNEYEQRFGGKYIVAMNAINVEKSFPFKNHSNNFVFTYAGNLGLNRWRVLCKLGKALDLLQDKYNDKRLILNICSLSQLSNKILKKFNSIKSIKYLGALDTEHLTNLKKESDVLVHVESFDKKNIIITRLSVSTKIPEYMLSNRCILAIGPDNISSIKYIKNNNIGLVLTSQNIELWLNELILLIKNKDTRNKYVMNAIKLGKKNHDYNLNQKKIKMAIYSCVKK